VAVGNIPNGLRQTFQNALPANGQWSVVVCSEPHKDRVTPTVNFFLGRGAVVAERSSPSNCGVACATLAPPGGPIQSQSPSMRHLAEFAGPLRRFSSTLSDE